jgi:hypothetical protein
MSTAPKVTYLRAGRTLRASGSIIETDTRTGMFKVKPARDEWKCVWITVNEIQNGGDRAPTSPAPNHIPAVGKMVDGLRILLSRKNVTTMAPPKPQYD